MANKELKNQYEIFENIIMNETNIDDRTQANIIVNEILKKLNVEL